MKITKHNIPSILLDNDIQMFNILFKVIEKIDQEASVQIHKSLKGYKVIIEVSKTSFKGQILKELEELSFILGDLFEFSKTIEFSKNITFYTK